VHAAVTLLLTAWLAWQVADIGVHTVLQALPTAPLFYLLFAAMVALLPASEILIFRRLWGPRLQGLIRALVMRRICSCHLFDYSGEAYLYVWARRAPGLTRADAGRGLRDNVVVSSVASTLFALLLGAGLLAADLLPLQLPVPPGTLLIMAVGVTAVAAGALVAARHRGWLSAAAPDLLLIGGIHLTRHALFHALQLLLWIVAEPQVPLASWIVLLGTHVVVARIPFLPSRDLLFASAGLSLAAHVDIAEAVIASLLLTAALLERGLSLALYVLLTWREGRRTAALRTGSLAPHRHAPVADGPIVAS
jgi:hypothetical protein